MRRRSEQRDVGVRPADRLQARLAGFTKPAAGFVALPEPRTIGVPRRGLQLVEGRFLFAGTLIEAPGVAPWDLAVPDSAFAAALHGFGWLDDLAALGDKRAEERARAWTLAWAARFGRGTGPGWTAALTGRRTLRWVHHASMLLEGAAGADRRAILAVLTRQTVFLSRRWGRAPAGRPRLEALAGLVHAASSLEGLDGLVGPAQRAMARECEARIDGKGGIASRSPEELLEIFALLAWSAAALTETGRGPLRPHTAAIERIAPVLRALRHADGGLARFHGGGRGAEGRLEQALAASGVRRGSAASPGQQAALTSRPPQGLAMGFARLSQGRSTVIIDAAPPPPEPHSAEAHASTLAFELTSGRRPVVVSCGSGASFGPRWRRAGRATAAHSTLEVEGFSSARLGLGGLRRSRRSGRRPVRVPEDLVDAPRRVTAERQPAEGGTLLALTHDGYVATHGLTHLRRLTLGFHGRTLEGEDRLEALGAAAQARVGEVLRRAVAGSIRFAIRFHLHPDVEAEADGRGARLLLRSGEVWTLRATAGDVQLRVEPSVYLESGRLQPRASQQVVLTGAVMGYATAVGWSLAVAAESPRGLRDVAMDDMLALD